MTTLPNWLQLIMIICLVGTTIFASYKLNRFRNYLKKQTKEIKQAVKDLKRSL